MTTWAERMHRRAATFSNVVTSCGQPNVPYPRRLEKVKFGAPLDEVCKNDIPGPLLVLILKLNKEAPVKKDVFRAPGHQGNMKKLVHFLQAGRLVNMDKYSVYTIASVLKKFLRKIPGGIFGRTNEQQLFTIVQMESVEQQRDEIHQLITSLPLYTQRLLVLLFGTFQVIATNANRFATGMTSEALGVSVAPSFFQSCVSDGKTAKMEDVLRFKVATKIMKLMIDNFGACNLFGRSNYEFYARITGRILKVEDDWIFSFRYPPDMSASMSHQEESQSTPALLHLPDLDNGASSSLGIIPENNLLESCTRLSISLEENGLFKGSSRSSSSSTSGNHMTLDELRAVNRYAESTKSLSYLPQVHERQTARMRTRSEWFLNPGYRLATSMDSDPTLHVLRGSNNLSSGNMGGAGLSASAESVSKRSCVRRNSSRSRHNRPSSRRNKENGNKSLQRQTPSLDGNQPLVPTLTYKPRI
uniref:Rho GTPase-activating protein 20 n=2 Tax=Lygus hesperus TaxID=30085 RepID=A0A146L3B2_LYGHE